MLGSKNKVYDYRFASVFAPAMWISGSWETPFAMVDDRTNAPFEHRCAATMARAMTWSLRRGAPSVAAIRRSFVRHLYDVECAGSIRRFRTSSCHEKFAAKKLIKNVARCPMARSHAKMDSAIRTAIPDWVGGTLELSAVDAWGECCLFFKSHESTRFERNSGFGGFRRFLASRNSSLVKS